jgi:hypothetical protein
LGTHEQDGGLEGQIEEDREEQRSEFGDGTRSAAAQDGDPAALGWGCTSTCLEKKNETFSFH